MSNFGSVAVLTNDECKEQRGWERSAYFPNWRWAGGWQGGLLGLERGGDVTERQKPYYVALSLRSMETEKGEIVKC